MYESVSRANLAQSGCSKLGSAWRRALSGVLVASACFVLLGQSGCDNANKPIIIKGPSVQPVQDIRWRTFRWNPPRTASRGRSWTASCSTPVGRAASPSGSRHAPGARRAARARGTLGFVEARES